MDVETNTESQGANRHGDGFEPARGRLIPGMTSGCVEIFKKSPIGADLYAQGRDVAQDIGEFTSIPLLTTSFDRDDLHGEAPKASAVAGRPVAEKWTTVEATHHRAVGLLADAPVGAGDIVSIGASAGIPNVKLTDFGPVARRSGKSGLSVRATNIPTISGAVICFGGAPENPSYAHV